MIFLSLIARTKNHDKELLSQVKEIILSHGNYEGKGLSWGRDVKKCPKHHAMGMLGTTITFQHGADLDQMQILDFLHLVKAQVAHDHTGPPTPGLGGVSFINVKKLLC